MRKNHIIIVALIAITGISFVSYNLTIGATVGPGDHADYTVAAKDMIREFQSSSGSANKKYSHKLVAVKGTVTEIDKDLIIFNDTIACRLQDADASIKTNQVVTLKGKFENFDDFMGEIRLNHCIKF